MVLRPAGALIDSPRCWVIVGLMDIIRPMLISGTAFLRLRTNR